MASYTWKGVSGDWNLASDWTPAGGPPKSTDSATIGMGRARPLPQGRETGSARRKDRRRGSRTITPLKNVMYV
jgi:hypothetical protein